MSPHRVQQKRTKGWTRPDNTVGVGRPTKFGNPYHSNDLPPGGSPAEDRAILVALFREMLLDPKTRERAGYPHPDYIRATLAGKDLMCWCPPEHTCHADVLLEIANATIQFGNDSIRCGAATGDRA